MNFNHVKVDLPSLSRETIGEQRLYLTPDGKKYPSVTTVLAEYSKQGILAWRKKVGEEKANKISLRATSRGTAVHAIIEKYLKNEDLSDHVMLPNAKSLFVKMKSALRCINNIHCLEAALFSHTMELAGTVDCIAEYNGVLSVIDFKTAEKLKKREYIGNYFMQCAAYATMYGEMTGSYPQQAVVLIGVDQEIEPQVFVDKPDDYLIELNTYIRKYKESQKC